jgi:hypothetical protein
MFGWDVGQRSAEAVRIDRLDATAILPISQRLFLLACRVQHFLVVALDEHDLALPLQSDNPFKHFARFLALVNHVAQEDDSIARRRSDGLEHGVERVDTTMNVADGDQTTRAHRRFSRR